MARRRIDDSKAFDNAVRSAIRDQARELGFTFTDETVPETETARVDEEEAAGGDS